VDIVTWLTVFGRILDRVMFVAVIPIPEIYESSGFMDAITSTPSSTMRRKKKAGVGKASTSPTSPTPPGKQPAVPSVSDDTLSKYI